jgi:hypothetical protein
MTEPQANGPGRTRARAASYNKWEAQRTGSPLNGSGSQTANSVLMRSIFQMGVPVSGKSMFPSNIAGLPTWFTIRANKHGYSGRKKEIDLVYAPERFMLHDGSRPGGPRCGAARRRAILRRRA